MAASRGVKRWRQLTVWLHVITSVGWMTQALTICVLLATSLSTTDRGVAVSSTAAAELLDMRLLAPMANASAFTGFMLAAATPWGFFRHWWVLAKFAITVVQLHLGIFVLSDALHASAAAAVAGTVGPTRAMVVGSACMAGAIAFQAWLSVAKPWSTTAWTTNRGRAGAPRTAPVWVFVATVCGGILDFAVAWLLGHPAPLLSLTILGTWLVLRRRVERRASRPERVPA
ncbi:hypothetical protein [Micromonospora echinofusca]|uniref:Sulfoxide reductase heme-binding subunit YedZ n=1 Tax=Micromonospora echinofusca TaxID=47858 RepID=A0ABS3VTW8_MICEH|nr:hypothetical protein [Micromonospora echinofusca]MBO4207980.1 hypothetical protein [Micromonospora echinofusca]